MFSDGPIPLWNAAAAGPAGAAAAQPHHGQSPPQPVEIMRTPIEEYALKRQVFDPAGDLLVELPRYDPAYREMVALCRQYKGMYYANRIHSIQKICNAQAYDKFWEEVEAYRRKPHAQVFKLLHGTPAVNKDSIVEKNLKEFIAINDFNRATHFYCGDGFYFTQSFPYAASFTTKGGLCNAVETENETEDETENETMSKGALPHDQTRLRHVFVFDVLVGDMYRPRRDTPEDQIPALLPEWAKIVLTNKKLLGSVLKPYQAKLPVFIRYDTTAPQDTSIESFAKFQEAEFYPTHVITYRA